jgi:hypothetical protein
MRGYQSVINPRALGLSSQIVFYQNPKFEESRLTTGL